MKTYKETKAEVKKLVEAIGINNLLNMHITPLYEAGHSGTNIQNALSYFRYPPQAAKYRQ